MLTYICIIIIVVAYVYLYTKPKNDFQLIQSTLNNITDDYLFEKYPIIIHDKLVNIDDLTDSLFKYQYLFKTYSIIDAHTTLQNRYKFMIIHNTNEEDCHFNLTNPSKKYTINTMLPSYNIAIIPFKWHLSDISLHLKSVLLNDLIHSFLNININ